MTRTILYYVLFTFLWVGNQQVTYAQTASITEGCSPLLVDFSPPDDQASYFWSFGNNVTSTERDPSTTFTQPGTYNVELRTTQSDTLIGSLIINVYARPTVDIVTDTTMGCVPFPVNFTAQASVNENIDIERYTWTYGDGATDNGINTTHIYDTPGIYSVAIELTTTQRGCSVTETFPALIQAGGIENVNFLTNPNPATTCNAPLVVSFLNLTPNLDDLSFSWDLGNGDTFDGVTAPATTYTESGQYVVELVATDSLGCSRNRRRPVFIASPNVDLDAIPDTLCLNSPYFFRRWAQADTVEWTWPASAVVEYDLILQDSFVIFTQAGPTQIGLRAANGTPIFCVLDTILNPVVDQVFATPAASPNFTCADTLVATFTVENTTANQFTWIFDDRTVLMGDTVEHTYRLQDTLTYSENGFRPFLTALAATNPSGCRDTFIRIDTIFTPNALFMADITEGCAPLTVTFSDSTNSFSPILEYVYDYGDGTDATFTSDETHLHTYTQPGEYPVTLRIENANGCRDTSYARIIKVGGPLDYEFSYVQNPLCPTDTVEFILETDLPDVDWLELQGDTLFAVYNGCVSQQINPSLIIQGPKVGLSYEIECEDPYLVNFSAEATDATGIIWDFGDGQTATTLTPNHRYTTTGDYLVTVTATNENTPCPAFTDTVLICIRDLQADFQLPDAICANTELALDASATQDVVGEFCANGFTWYFDLNGRPEQGNDTILDKVFTTPGLETVTLIAKDINGCRDTVSRSMNIYSIEPDFNISDTLICLPATVTFTDNSQADTTLVNWEWDFGDGQTGSERSVTHTFDMPPTIVADTFFISLRLDDALGCPQNDTAFIVVYEPVSEIVTDPINRGICTGEMVTFTGTQFTDGGSSLDFSWEFSNGPDTDEDVVTRTFPEVGSFNVRMNYIEIGSGCGGSQSTTINVQNFPSASFTTDVDGEDVICAPATISFTSTSESTVPLNYRWDFDNGDSPSNDQNPVVTFERGTYEVTFTTTTSNGCTGEIVRTLDIVGPTGNFFFPADPICQGDMVTFTLQDTAEISSWTWDFGDGNVLSNVNPATHTYDDLPPADFIPVTLILRGENENCEFPVTRELPIGNVRADFTLNSVGDTALCAGTYRLINNSIGADSYFWTLPGGETSTEFEPSVTFEPGTYTISLDVESDTESCIDQEVKVFTFFALPDLEITSDTVCLGDTTQLNIINIEPDWAVSWSPTAPLISSPTSPNPLALLETDTEFIVTLRTVDGCETTDTTTATVITPFPWEDIDVARCPEDPLNIELPELDTPYIITWSPSPPPDTIGIEDVDLTLTITDSLGCFFDEYMFFVQSVSDSLIVPNFFSPNGDNVNDEFRLFTEMDPEDPEQMIIESFKVFNRWGQLVYEGGGPDARWDGQHNDKPAPADVYIYQIIVDITKSGRQVNLKGQVTLAR